MEFDIVNPDATGTIASLRSLGYSVEAAVADLVDNSIAAAATTVDVRFTWAGRDSWVAVSDNGGGMSPDGLVTAMTIAGTGTSADRSAADLGRFGMGLKTASFSQAGQLVVSTLGKDGGWSTRTWDLDIVRATGEWRLVKGADETATKVLELLQNDHAGESGTIVLWRRLHRFNSERVRQDDEATQSQFYSEQARVSLLLGMVFGRFLSGRRAMTIRVAGTAIAPWDPFLSTHPAVQQLPSEELPVAGHLITVQPYVLPHPRRLSPESYDAAGGPGGWLEQQGFYVYRRNRLILAGDWLGLRGLRRDEKHNLARLAVDVPAELDSEWAVDVRKSSVVPPVAARSALRRIGNATRRAAREVLTHRGRINARAHGADFVYAWRVDRNDERVRSRVNRQHPLVARVLAGNSSAADARALVSLLEETVPVAALRILHETDAVDDPEPFSEASSPEVTAVAERIYAALVDQGTTPREAKLRISQMEPFDRMDGFWRS